MSSRYAAYDRVFKHLDEVKDRSLFGTYNDLQRIFHEEDKLVFIWPSDSFFDTTLYEMQENEHITVDAHRLVIITPKGRKLYLDGGYSKQYELHRKKQQEEKSLRKSTIWKNWGQSFNLSNNIDHFNTCLPQKIDGKRNRRKKHFGIWIECTSKNYNKWHCVCHDILSVRNMAWFFEGKQ